MWRMAAAVLVGATSTDVLAQGRLCVDVIHLVVLRVTFVLVPEKSVVVGVRPACGGVYLYAQK